jgi:hypothetical protein
MAYYVVLVELSGLESRFFFASFASSRSILRSNVMVAMLLGVLA